MANPQGTRSSNKRSAEEALGINLNRGRERPNKRPGPNPRYQSLSPTPGEGRDEEEIVVETPPPEPTTQELLRMINRQGQQLDRQGQQLSQIINHISGERGQEDEAQVPSPRGNAQTPTPRSGPRQLVKESCEWISDSLLQDIVELKLDVKDLPKLIPPHNRPKGRMAASSITATSILFDTANPTAQIIEPDEIAYDKDIPNIRVLTSILTIYGAIRSLWDMDNPNIGATISLYTSMLNRWDQYDRFSFKGILRYFISHFQKYQTSTKFRDWTTIDNHLHATHMVRILSNPTYTQSPPGTSPAKAPSPFKHPAPGSPQKIDPYLICRNYNNKSRGCNVKLCLRQHFCIVCLDEAQTLPVFQCRKCQN